MNLDAIRAHLAEKVAQLYPKDDVPPKFAFIFHNSDPHNSEHLIDHFDVSKELTGFTGSNSTLVIMPETAHLWTDSRYWTQAPTELVAGWLMMKERDDPNIPGPAEWLAAQAAGARERVVCLFSAETTTVEARTKLEKALNGLPVESIACPFYIKEIWPSRPQMPAYSVYTLPSAMIGESAGVRIQKVVDEALKAHKNKPPTAIVSTRCDAIDWMLLTRGKGLMPTTPVTMAQVVIGVAELTVRLFITRPEVTINDDTISTLTASCAPFTLTVEPYAAFLGALTTLARDGARVCYSPRETTLPVPLPTVAPVDSVFSAPMRAKTSSELDLMEAAIVTDSAALCTFLAWVCREHDAGRNVCECAMVARLAEIRLQFGAVGDSFDAIIGTGPNSAVVHYKPKPGDNEGMLRDGPILIDSGGQYFDDLTSPDPRLGTTDVTRSLCLGSAPALYPEAYTAVLQGHIDLAMAVFRHGAAGCTLDHLARAPLLASGTDYGHGTGHGVGCYLMVHEGDYTVSPAPRPAPLVTGAVLSNEPGCYMPDRWGIRIESLMKVVEAIPGPLSQPNDKPVLRFETLTLAPIQTTHLVRPMLTASQVAWLNAYHSRVRERVCPLVDEETAMWIRSVTGRL